MTNTAALEAIAREVAIDQIRQFIDAVSRDALIPILVGDDYELDAETAAVTAGRVVELMRGTDVVLPPWTE